jgi:hypothetical protein
MRNPLVLFCRKLAEFRIRRKASEIRNRRADRDNNLISARSCTPSPSLCAPSAAGQANAVRTLAGVLLPSATVFLLLLANDEAVPGPWVNTRALNLITGAIVAVLVMLSIILTASVLFPEMGEEVIIGILAGGSIVAVLTTIAVLAMQRIKAKPSRTGDLSLKWQWRMPPLDELAPARFTVLNRIWMIVLRAYLIIAAGLVLLRIFRLATAGA